MSGFIDPAAPLDRRIERLEYLLAWALSAADTAALSPEAKAELDALMSGDRGRRDRALLRLHRTMAHDPESGPLHAEECEWDKCPFRTTPPERQSS